MHAKFESLLPGTAIPPAMRFNMRTRSQLGIEQRFFYGQQVEPYQDACPKSWKTVEIYKKQSGDKKTAWNRAESFIRAAGRSLLFSAAIPQNQWKTKILKKITKSCELYSNYRNLWTYLRIHQNFWNSLKIHANRRSHANSWKSVKRLEPSIQETRPPNTPSLSLFFQGQQFHPQCVSTSYHRVIECWRSRRQRRQPVNNVEWLRGAADDKQTQTAITQINHH